MTEQFSLPHDGALTEKQAYDWAEFLSKSLERPNYIIATPNGYAVTDNPAGSYVVDVAVDGVFEG